MSKNVAIAACFVLGSVYALSQTPSTHEYQLGPDDQVKVWALGFEEFSDKPVRIDPGGYLSLPMIGQVKAAGLTVQQLQDALAEKMKKMVLHPEVSVSIVDYGSQPVSVIGAVNQPGVHQLQGRKSLAEVLSMAGGTRQDAGSVINITREAQWGPIPLPNASKDPNGAFYTAQIKVTDLFGAKTPADNVQILPHDVIAVPVAENISVIGAVQKPGAFPLNTRTSMSALEALAMAGGPGPQPKLQDAKILRMVPGRVDRQEIPIDLKKIELGKAEDIALRPNDILLVPTSASKKVGVAVAQAVLSAAVGVAVWRSF
jgi:polysaccharide export outer membrane protein